MKTERQKKIKWGRQTAAVCMGIAVLLAVVCPLWTGDVFGATAFDDVSMKQWYGKFVTELSEEGIVSGYPDGTFRPGNTVTCAQFLSMALQTADRIEALPPYQEEGTDVSGHWARSFYDRALAQEVLFRDELPLTALDRPISREWMAVISSRLSPENAVPSVKYEAALEGISDLDELSPHSYEIVTAYTAGLLSGYKDGTFRPGGYLTRAEAAAVIYQLKGLWMSQGSGGQTKPPAEESPEQPPVSEPPRKEETPPEEPKPQIVSWEIGPRDFPAKTLAFYYDLDGEQDDSPAELKRCIEERINSGGFDRSKELADQLYQSFQGFRERAVSQREQGKQGLRKEYVCDYPVMMEAVSGKINIYLKPRGTETEYWEVTPGQVSEEFF